MTNAENALIVWPVKRPTPGGSRCKAFVMDVGVGALLDQPLPLRCPSTLTLEGRVQRGARQGVKVPRPWPPAACGRRSAGGSPLACRQQRQRGGLPGLHAPSGQAL